VIGYAIFFRVNFPDPGVQIATNTGIIQNLETNGFLEQAGFQTGDQMVSVAGRAWRDVSNVYGNAHAQETITWELVREKQLTHITTNLPALSWSQRLRNSIPLLVALFYWGIATVLWLYNPQHKTIRHFFLLSQLVALILAGGGLETFSVRFGGYLYFVALIAVIPVTIHFFATFPKRYESRLIRRLIFASYGIALLFIARFILQLFQHASPRLGNVWRLMLQGYFFVSLLFAVMLFFYRWFKTPPQVRQRQRLIVAGMLASLLPFLFFYLLPNLLNSTLLISQNWLFLSLIFLPLAVAYALHSGEVGTIDWFLNRTLVHVLLFGLMAGLYAGLFWLLNTFFPKTREASLLVATILAVSLAVLFSPLHRILQYWVDQIFYRGWYDYRSVVEQTGQQLVHAERPQELAQVLLENVTTTMKLRCACFVLPQSDTNESGSLFIHAPKGCPLQNFETLQISISPPFYQALQTPTTILETATLRQRIPVSQLSEMEKTLVQCPHAQLWIPSRLPDESPAPEAPAELIIGPKQSNEAFSEEDRTILTTLARQTALVIKNLRLLIQLQQREKELMHLYKNLTFVRENERKRIARELHDDIIQNIHVIYRSIKDRHVLHPEQAEASLEKSAQRLKQTMNDVRRICNDLRPATLEVLGLTDAIRSQCDRFNERSNTTINFYVEGDSEILLPEQTENMLFRIFQEALWNAEKHAHANQIDVRLTFPEKNQGQSNATVQLIVQDDGQGMKALPRFDDLLERRSYGLLNMQERAAMVGGALQFWSQWGKGVRIEVTVPTTLPEG
jgi:signal transduction histidine kinase